MAPRTSPSIVGVVRWVRSRQIGVEFLDLRGDAAARVLRHVEQGMRRPQ